jgi:DNA-binding transcriptional LysR family regulator
MLDSWTLRVLVEVADRGSLSAAGEALAMTQPAVSRQIAGLERQLGVALFRREPRGVTPTSEGAIAVELARGVVTRAEAMEATMRSLAGLDAGRLRICAFASVNTWFVPEAIRAMHADHPDVVITLLQVDPQDAVAAVKTGHVDLALVTAWQLYDDPAVAREDPDAARRADLDDVDLLPLADEDMVVAFAASDPLARAAKVPLADLREATWVEGAYPDCLGPIPRLAEALGAAPRIGFTCHDWNGKQALVAGGEGIMLVPSLARRALRTDLELRPTRPALPTRRLYAAVSRPPYRSAATEEMLTVLSRLAQASSSV